MWFDRLRGLKEVSGPLGFGAGLCAAVLAMDLVTPNILGTSLVYVAPVFLALWTPDRRVLWPLAGLASLFLIIGSVVAEPVESIRFNAAARGLALFAIWAFAYLIERAQVAEERRDEALAAGRDLAARKDILYSVLENLVEGVCVYDRSLRLKTWSRGLVDLFGLSEAWLRTSPSLEEFMRFNAEKGDYANVDADRLIAERMVKARLTIEPHKYERTRADGTVLEVRGEPLKGGGLVTIYRDITEIKLAEATIDRLSRTDVLTGLPNRSAFEGRLKSKLGDAERSDRLLSVMFLDIDNFKDVNDTLGHPVGDQLLVEITECLLDCVRDTDVVARLDGDEFGIVGTHHQTIDDVAEMADRIINAFSRPFKVGEIEIRATVSVGVTVFPKDQGSAEKLLTNADIALAKAKQKGRDNFQFYETYMQDEILDRKCLETEMAAGLEGGEFEPFYQPKIDVATGKVIGAEALMRWHHPERGMVPPAVFIPIAEKSGLILPLSKMLLEVTCREAKSWQDDPRLPPLTLSANVSPVQFNNPDFVDEIARVLKLTGLEAERLELEITENTIMSHSDNVVETLDAVRRLGVVLSIDDFGTGYSSLAYLKRFPVHKLKIDQSFVRDLETDSDDAAIVKTVVSMGHALGMSVVAEGVETAEQYAFLKVIGCDEAQGYHFSRPAPADEFKRWVINWEDRKVLAART